MGSRIIGLQSKTRTVDRVAYTAVVSRVDDDGAGPAWVTEIGADPRHPIGPCRREVGILRLGARVLVLETDDGPWIAAVENTTGWPEEP